MSDLVDGLNLLYCPKCGGHWEIDMLIGDWVPVHMGCDQTLAACRVLAHRVGTIDDHRTGPSANGSSSRELQSMERP